MSVVSSLYSRIRRVNSKVVVTKTLNILTLLLVMYMSFNTLNTYAISAEEIMNTKIDIQESYKDAEAVNSAAAKDTGPNLHKTSYLNTLAGAFTGVSVFMGVEGFTNSESVMNDPEISPLSKRGLLGYSDDAVMALYQNQPNINVPQHMARQWIPGYDQSARSTIAAEDGYDLLVSTGVDQMWEQMRMIAYILFVIVLMAAGFMIMFRQKIGGQLMVTVFNTLPGVVIGLVTVTFSFAIVGFVLNIGMLLVNVIAALLDPSGQSLLSINGPFSLLSLKNIGGFITESSQARSFTIGSSSLIAVFMGSIAAIFQGAGLLATGAGLGPVIAVGMIAFFIIILFIAFAVLWASVKVFITVLTAYIGIIIDTVLGPLYLVASALPGKGYIGGDWFKRILRNTLAFPVVFFFVNLGGYILKQEIDFSFPSGLVGAEGSGVDAALTDGVGWFLKASLTLILFFVAAESPKFLTDILPTNGGKGAEAVIGGTKASLSKIPLIGGFFG